MTVKGGSQSVINTILIKAAGVLSSWYGWSDGHESSSYRLGGVVLSLDKFHKRRNLGLHCSLMCL